MYTINIKNNKKQNNHNTQSNHIDNIKHQKIKTQDEMRNLPFIKIALDAYNINCAQIINNNTKCANTNGTNDETTRKNINNQSHTNTNDKNYEQNIHNILKSDFIKNLLRFENFVICGTGGSILSACVFYDLSSIINHNNKKIKFIDNLDPIAFYEAIYNIDLCNTGFIFISKSGETLETCTQLEYFLSIFKNNNNEKLTDKKHHSDYTYINNNKNRISNDTDQYLNNNNNKDQNLKNNNNLIHKVLTENTIIISENKQSKITTLAKEYSICQITHPNDIGGRFSVFSIVGMLPAVILGFNPTKMFEYMHDNFAQIYENAKKCAIKNFETYTNGIKQNVYFIYSKRLISFGKWISQLYAESSGKNGEGVTPIVAHGSIDQHSQLQLYLDGSRDKNFIFINESKEIITSMINHHNQYNENLNKNINNQNYYKMINIEMLQQIQNIFHIQFDACSEVIAKDNPTITAHVNLSDLNKIGEFFLHFLLEIIIFCDLINVNPFGQDSVEKVKTLTELKINTELKLESK